jgi:hypothetical protein
MTVGAVLPIGAKVGSVALDGRAAQYQLVTTARGTEVRVAARGPHAMLRITLR